MAGIRWQSWAPETAELVIVGGGVIGAATAFHAARAGIRPLIVEARPRIASLTTPAAAGAFRLQFDTLEELALVRESAETFLGFAEVTGQRRYDLRLRLQGYLWLTTDQAKAAHQRATVDRLHAWGQTDVELLTGDEARERFPYVGPNVIQARFRAGDGFLDTKQLTYGLAEGAEADVLTDCAVTGFEVHGGRLHGVRTTRGAIATSSAVICAGPLSSIVAASTGLELPMHTVVRQKVIFPELGEVPSNAPMTIDEDTGAHWRPAYDRGAWLLFTDPATPPSQPTADVPTDHSFAFRLLNPDSPVGVGRVVPFWRDVWERGADHWLLQAGQYEITPDYRPLIGPSPIEGLLVNTGYSGHGIMLSVAGGRILAETLTGALKPTDNPFSPDRSFTAIAQPTL
jgi:sarcosine oxidase subunit beta